MVTSENTLTRKWAMYQISAAMSNIEVLKKLVSDIDGEEGSDMADGPANGAVARQAAARTAATKKPAAKAAPQEEAEESDGLDFLNEDAPETAALTEDDLKVAIKKFAAAFGKAKVTDLLAKYKAKAIQDVKPAKYEELINLVDKALSKYKK